MNVSAAYGAFAGHVRRPLHEIMSEYDEDERLAEARKLAHEE